MRSLQIRIHLSSWSFGESRSFLWVSIWSGEGFSTPPGKRHVFFTHLQMNGFLSSYVRHKRRWLQAIFEQYRGSRKNCVRMGLALSNSATHRERVQQLMACISALEIRCSSTLMTQMRSQAGYLPRSGFLTQLHLVPRNRLNQPKLCALASSNTSNSPSSARRGAPSFSRA